MLEKCNIMRCCILLLACQTIFGQYEERHPTNELARVRRSAVGALHIVNNHAQPIHADVKPDNSVDTIEKPCLKGNVPSHVEPGVVFQVTAPEDTVYELKSLRKSLPSHHSASGFDLIRSISRVVTLTVLIVSAIFEFYPMLHNLITSIQNYIN